MAIDPRIALGVQPIQQQPNMLAQYAQIMGIKAAQQELESNEGLRGELSQGIPDDPSKLLRYGPKGRAVYESVLKGKKEKLESDDKRNVMLGGLAGPVMENPTLTNFKFALDRAESFGLMTPQQKQEVLTQYGSNPESIKAYASQIFKGSITAQAQQADATSRSNNAATVGASYYSSNVSRDNTANRLAFDEKKFKFEQDNPGYEYKTLDNGSIAAVNKRTNAVTLLQTPNAALTPTAVTPPVNTLSPTTSLNALINPPVVNQPGAPTRANAAALTPTPLRVAPRPGYEYNAQGQQVLISDPTKVVSTVTDKFGNVSMLNAAGDVVKKVEGMGKPSATVEAQQQKEVVSKEGRESVNRVLGNLYSEYTNLVKAGGITDTRQSVEENISARTGASALGQLTGSFTGSEAQSFRDTIAQTRPLLLTAIMKATGLSATQLNSNVELQTYLKTATDDKVSIQSNVKALNTISQMFGLGKKFEVPEIPKAEPKTAASSGATVTTPDGRTIVFPDAASAAKFKKEAGIK